MAIDSSPAGADIIIEGRSYGRTPAVIKIEPRNYIATISKEGYGTAQLKLESWQAVRRDKGEGGRCIVDAMGTMLILPALSYWSVYCRDFKEPSYFVSIPYQGPARNADGGYGAGMGGRGYGYAVPPAIEYGAPSSNMGYNKYDTRGIKRSPSGAPSESYYDSNFSGGDEVY